MTFLERIRKSILENKIIFVALVTLVTVNIFVGLNEKKPAENRQPLQADTIIPAGHVLMPLTLMNIESIKGLIKDFGIIDLYVATTPNSSGKKLASRIKILRAPLNENEFAVLVPEELSELIMKTSGYFTGVVQNRFVEPGGSALRMKKESTVQIDYNQETSL